MKRPAIIEFERLLAETRESILSPGISTRALLSDALMELGYAPLGREQPGTLLGAPETPGRKAILRLSCRLLSHPFFAEWSGERGESGRAAILEALSAIARERADEAKPGRCMAEGDGREELARALFIGLGERFDGESEAQSRDRFQAVDSVERRAVMERAKAAERRAREIREAMERQEAEEAASKMQRD